jgi:sugar/nucleoside kinase (ribokinase family)
MKHREKEGVQLVSDNPKLLIIGSVNVDLILGVLDELPRRGTEVMMSQKETRVGGNAANTAFAFAALGGRSQVIANIGADMFGDWVGAAFPEDSRHWPRSALPTTISVGLTHSDGERTFLTSSGHLDTFSLEDALGQIPAKAGKGDIALVCSPFLMPLLLGRLDALIAELQRRGYQVALDTGWPPQGWTMEIRTRLAGWLRAVEHALLSENEALAFAGGDDLEQALDKLHGLIGPGTTLVVKCGPNGAVTRENGRTLAMPAPKVEVVDTIGAGDIFNAGYLHGHMRGETLKSRLASGVEAASAAISTLPRRYGSGR